QPVLERAGERLRASQARDSRRDWHGAVDRIGAARVATIGRRQRKLFDRRPLESGHAVELVPARFAFLRHGIYTAPLESPRFPGYRLSEGAIYAIRLRRNSICIACAVRRYCRP